MNPISTRHAGNARPTVICLHSSGGSGAQWLAFRSRLAPDADVVTPDFHGHGAGPDWRGVDADIVAVDAARVARLAVGAPDGVHLVGHSYGGAIALRVALHHPESVRSVTAYEPVAFRVLFDHYGRRRPAAEVTDVARDLRRRLRGADAVGAAARFVDYWGGAGTWRSLSIAQQAGIASRMAVVAAHFTGLAGDVVRLSDYRAIGAPTLLLAGRRTRPPMRRIDELLRYAMPGAVSGIMDGMGHMGPITHPQSVAERIEAFVRWHAGIGAPAERRLAA